ncbi:MAG: DNA polymerase I [Acidobacteria bacterium]|nr:DNA polymerase I [Acidobacteriota bacterium]
MPRLFLIDGNSQMYRAYHAIRELSGPDGKSTNAIYGFVNMLRKLITDHHPDYLVASFDLPGRTFRDDLAADYKANRAPMPTDLAEQVPLVHDACEAMGVPYLTVAGFEADDVLGTLAVKARAAGFDVAIVTGDKDFFQLVTDGLAIYNPKDDGTWFDAEGVLAKFGVRPEQVVDVLALMGDSVDNIKGVPGIGEKGARALITSHGTLDALLAAAPGLTQKRYRDALTQHAEDARASRVLATIRLDVPVEFDADALRYRGPDAARCYALFSSLGFRTLTPEFAPTAATSAQDYAVVTTLEELDAITDAARAAGQLSVAALAAVAAGTSAVDATVVGLSLATAPHQARYVPLTHSGLTETPNLRTRDVASRLAPLFADPAVAKIGHDLKSTSVLCARIGCPLSGLDLDTMIASYVVDATGSSHGLRDLALARTGYGAVQVDEVTGRGSKAVSLDAVPATSLLNFAGERADLPLRMADSLRADLADPALSAVYRDFELPLIPILADIEREGVGLDVEALARLSSSMQDDLDRLSASIFGLAGEEFNINSPKQLGEILFERLQLPSTKKTGKTRASSTAMAVLEELAQTHELPGLVLQWRSVQKLKGTYVDALPLLVNPATGRVHTTFNQAVAATGRLSSSDPNLQNIPVRTSTGRQIRAAFIAAPGHALISADYSQIELRVLAHLSGDTALIEAFKHGEDIHDQTAARVFGTDSGLDPHELRRRAKIINYALLYGKTAFTLAKDIGVPQQAAQEFIDAYFAGFPAVRTFIDQTLDAARQSGVVRTLTGRQRLMPELTSRNGQIRAAAERETVNMPIQGTAADILKKAMIDVASALASHNATAAVPSRMILTVHDELLFEAPEGDVPTMMTLVRDTMEAAFALAVPLTVDVGSGPNWDAAKP